MDYFNNYDYPEPERSIEHPSKFLNEIQQTSSYVPFNPYWYHNVNYHDLDPDQTKWYSYWRSQVRNSNYLPTDLGYVFLYANEVLNMIGFENHYHAYEFLVNLWIHYRTIEVPRNQYVTVIWDEGQFIEARIHPLDRYLVDWIADFIHVHKLPIKITDWYMNAIDKGVTLSDRQLFLELWLQSNKSLVDIPLDGLFGLARYYPPYNKFYESFHTVCNLDSVYRQGVAAIEDFIAKDNSSLFIKSARPYTLKRIPFEGSFHFSSRRKISVANLSIQVDYRILSNHLTNIIKYAENIFRVRMKFRTKLRDIVIDNDWKHVLDATFEVKPRAIQIDFQRVLEISQNSNAVRDRLIVEEDDGSKEIKPVSTMLTESEPNFSIHKTILLALRNQSWEITEQTLKSLVAEEFSHVVIDQINEWGIETYGDVLIIMKDGMYILVEDYRSEVTILLDQTT